MGRATNILSATQQERKIHAVTYQVGDEHTLNQLRREIAILRKVSYDANIVQFYGACTTDPVMLVMEYMEVRDYGVLLVTSGIVSLL